VAAPAATAVAERPEPAAEPAEDEEKETE
jgi:hypothetical protein